MRGPAYITRKVARQMRWAKPGLHRLLMKHLPNAENLHGIDLGGGKGAVSVALTDTGINMTLVDRNLQSICHAEGLAHTHGNYSRFGFFYGHMNDAVSVIAAQYSPDFVLCLDVVEHTGTYHVLHAIKSMLKHGGIAVVTFPPYNGPFGLHQQTLPWMLSHVPWSGLLFARWFNSLKYRCHDDSAATAWDYMANTSNFEADVFYADLAIIERRRYLIRPERSRFAIRLPWWAPDWLTASVLYVLKVPEQ